MWYISLPSTLPRACALPLSTRRQGDVAIMTDPTLWLRGFTDEGRNAIVVAITIAGTPVNPGQSCTGSSTATSVRDATSSWTCPPVAAPTA